VVWHGEEEGLQALMRSIFKTAVLAASLLQLDDYRCGAHGTGLLSKERAFVECGCDGQVVVRALITIQTRLSFWTVVCCRGALYVQVFSSGWGAGIFSFVCALAL